MKLTKMQKSLKISRPKTMRKTTRIISTMMIKELTNQTKTTPYATNTSFLQKWPNKMSGKLKKKLPGGSRKIREEVLTTAERNLCARRIRKDSSEPGTQLLRRKSTLRKQGTRT